MAAVSSRRAPVHRLTLGPILRPFPWFALRLLSALATALLGLAPASAQNASTPEARQAEVSAAWQAAEKTGKRGPAEVALRDQGRLKLPENYFFVPADEGLRIMRAYGNTPNPATFTGLVVGTRTDDSWLIVINFVKEGYIKDDDAKDWNADDLLKSLREGTEEANKNRAERGFPEVEIVGWVEKPGYSPTTHRLIWSLSNKNKGQATTNDLHVNYNTYALGREGYFSINLLTLLAQVEQQKSIPQTMLANLEYETGKRYDDFNPTTDKVAEYGLAALVGVAAAKKLGLFALIAVFFAKFAKIIIVAVAGGGALVFKLFGRGKNDTPPTAPPTTPQA